MGWIIIIVALAMMLYYFRKEIAAYFNREIESNRNLNYTDEEIELYIKKYSTWPSEDLAQLSNPGKLGGKELLAIRKVLMQRNMFP